MQTNFSQPFFTFWDHLLGTVWTGGDVSARYERSALLAVKKMNSSITNTTNTSNQPAETYEKVADLVTLPKIPTGKAENQAAESREQVLADAENGGASILAEEVAEEEKVVVEKNIRTTNHRRTASNSLKGLRQRVGSFGRKGGIIGVEKR